jgi:hypothetical protein
LTVCLQGYFKFTGLYFGGVEGSCLNLQHLQLHPVEGFPSSTHHFDSIAQVPGFKLSLSPSLSKFHKKSHLALWFSVACKDLDNFKSINLFYISCMQPLKARSEFYKRNFISLPSSSLNLSLTSLQIPSIF